MAVSYYKLAYGTILSMAVGSTVYVAGLSYVTRDQIIEVTEGVLERSAAISTWPLTNYATNKAGWNTSQKLGVYIPESVRANETNMTGVTSWADYLTYYGFADDQEAAEYLVAFYPGQVSPGGSVTVSGTNSDTFAGTNWNYNPFLGIPLIGSGPSRDLIIRNGQWIETRGTNFLFDVTNNVPVYLTHSNIWELAGIGDSNYPNWTIGSTNGVKIYGPITGLLYHGQSYVLDEQVRALKLMTTTARASAWEPGLTQTFDQDCYWGLDVPVVEVLKTDPPPEWWTNVVGYGWRVTTSEFNAAWQDAKVYGSHLVYGAGSAATAAPYETFGFYGPTNATYYRWDREEYPDIWVYAGRQYGDPDGIERATRHTASGGVWVANLAQGVTVDVQMAWSYTGSFVNVSGDYGSSSATTSGVGLAGTGMATIACSGVSTGWAGLAWVLPAQGLTNVLDVSAQEATGVWTNFSAAGDSVTYSNIPPPSLTGFSQTSFNGPAILRWTFTRCKP
jgi:hypothetical protein